MALRKTWMLMMKERTQKHGHNRHSIRRLRRELPYLLYRSNRLPNHCRLQDRPLVYLQQGPNQLGSKQHRLRNLSNRYRCRRLKAAIHIINSATGTLRLPVSRMLLVQHRRPTNRSVSRPSRRRRSSINMTSMALRLKLKLPVNSKLRSPTSELSLRLQQAIHHTIHRTISVTHSRIITKTTGSKCSRANLIAAPLSRELEAVSGVT